jgi:hypothetical protein
MFSSPASSNNIPEFLTYLKTIIYNNNKDVQIDPDSICGSFSSDKQHSRWENWLQTD